MQTASKHAGGLADSCDLNDESITSLLHPLTLSLRRLFNQRRSTIFFVCPNCPAVRR